MERIWDTWPLYPAPHVARTMPYRLGGYRFPWLGTWCKTGAPVCAGPHTWHGLIGRKLPVSSTICNFRCMEVAFPDGKVLPQEWAEVVTAREEVLMRRCDWQLGPETWIDPLNSLRRPSREGVLIDVKLRVQRALGTRNICVDCLAAVCPECEDDAEAANLPEWHVVWKWLIQAQSTSLPTRPVRSGCLPGDHGGKWTYLNLKMVEHFSRF